MLRIRSLIPLTAAAAFAVPLALAESALASPMTSRASDSDFAGYQSQASGLSHVNVTTQFVVPAVKKCGDARKVIIPFVAADAGTTEGAAVGLDIHCRHGRVIYFPIFNAGGPNKAFASARAHPGDKIVLRLSANTTRLSLAVVDKTHPSVTRTLTGPGSSSFSRPSIGDSVVGGSPPVPDFGKVTFSKSEINGRALGRASKLARFDLVNSSHVLQIKTGPLRTDNESFKTVFKHS